MTVSAEPGGRWRCRTAGGLEFGGVAAVALAEGQPVTAAIRPEKLVPGDDEGAARLGPAANTAKGVVEESIYVGDFTRYRVGLGPPGAIVVKVANRFAARPLVPGAAVALAWSPDDTRLFPRSVA